MVDKLSKLHETQGGNQALSGDPLYGMIEVQKSYEASRLTEYDLPSYLRLLHFIFTYMVV